jgi:hypothetical protein
MDGEFFNLFYIGENGLAIKIFFSFKNKNLAIFGKKKKGFTKNTQGNRRIRMAHNGGENHEFAIREGNGSFSERCRAREISKFQE